MKFSRRVALRLGISTLVVSAFVRIGRAQTYPARPVRMIVPFAPAGTTDISASLIGQWLSERLGQQFVIENRGGANGNIGTEAALKAGPDGYTLLMVDASPTINATLYEKLTFKFRSGCGSSGHGRARAVHSRSPSVGACENAP